MFSKACEYAIRATVYLAQKTSEEEKLGVEAIAEGIDAPKAFVAKILQQLNREAVIRSVKGPNGGFFLSEKLKEQPVWNVLVAFAEEERVTNCVMGLHLCNDKKPCPLHLQYKDIKHQLVQLFKDKKIRELADNMKQTKLFIRHQ
ncbi:MAG: Rrf2 family transcriptional regulator [Chitinophagaceae bacterium]|nr:MAG: Rrf2 family transcriptional regulator [Chitinophagaceae bacterium]